MITDGLISQPDVLENPLVMKLMQFLINNRANRARMEEVISNYVDAVAQLGNPAQVDPVRGCPGDP